MSKNIRVFAAQCVDVDKQSPETLCKFTSKFKVAIIALSAFDSGVQWGDQAQKSLFLDVVNHKDTQWMIDRCNNLSYHDTIAFFCNEAARSMDPEVAQRRKHTRCAQTAVSEAHQESVHWIFNARQSLCIPNSLWRALDSDTQQAINKAHLQLSWDNSNPSATGGPTSSK